MTETTKYKFDAATVLKRSTEQIEDDKKLQAENAERLAHLVARTPAIAQYKTAAGAEESIVMELEKLAARLGASEDEERSAAFGALIDQAFDRLAECAFWQGKFTAAVDFAVNLDKKNEYLQFKVAALNLDLPVCSCTTIQFASKTSAKGNSVPAKREIQRVYSGALEKELKFIKCEKCRRIFAQTA